MSKKDYNKHANEVLEIVGSNIRKARGLMTQKELAPKAGITRQVISKIEQNKPISLDSLIKIAKALNVEPADLFLSEEDKREVTHKFKLVVQKLFDALLAIDRDEVGK